TTFSRIAAGGSAGCRAVVMFDHRSSSNAPRMIAPGSGGRLSGSRARQWLLVFVVVAFLVRLAFDVPVFRHTGVALTPDARAGYLPLAHHLGDGYLHSESRLFEV